MRISLPRAATAALLVSGIGLTAIAPTAPAATGSIRAMSHFHPRGADYSYVCARVRGAPSRRSAARIVGPAVVGLTRVTFRFSDEGKYTLTWKIRAPGDYRLTLIDRPTGDRLDRKRYSVPPPPPAGSRRGPFRCPTRSHRDW